MVRHEWSEIKADYLLKLAAMCIVQMRKEEDERRERERMVQATC